jgi:hypothetical protein
MIVAMIPMPAHRISNHERLYDDCHCQIGQSDSSLDSFGTRPNFGAVMRMPGLFSTSTAFAESYSRYLHKLVLCVALILASQNFIHAGLVTPISSAFTSPLTETWETFPLGFPIGSVDFLNGYGTASGQALVIYSQGNEFNPDGFGLGPFRAKVHDGTRGFGVSSSIAVVTFRFDAPISMFGGFWGAGSATNPITVTFLDSQNAAIGQTQFLYGRPNFDGTLEWHGWGIDMPATSVRVSGAFFVNDSLRVVPVPEPRTALFGIALFGAVRTTRTGRSYGSKLRERVNFRT